MTRRDYISTANILNRYFRETVTTETEASFDAMVNDFADMFSMDNERFMRTRFVDSVYEV